MAHLVVVGSINMDIVQQVEQFPLPGETVKGWGTLYSPGGKGANQAAAAARAGARVTMVGAVGEDAFGAVLKHTLEDAQVDTGAVLVKPGASGLALITVSGSGQNQIVLSGGANERLSAEDATEALAAIGEPIDGIILQNELLWETTWAAIQWAAERHIPVYYNPAPAMKPPQGCLASLHTIILNETEAHAITGIEVGSTEEAGTAAASLLEAGVRAVLLTLGERGSLYCDAAGAKLYTPAFRVQAVDTTGAGDTFIGAWTAHCAASTVTEGSMADSLRYATAASALAVSRRGAISAIPTDADIRSFLAEAGR